VSGDGSETHDTIIEANQRQLSADSVEELACRLEFLTGG